MIIQVLSIVLLSMIAVTVLIDVIPIMKDWLSRIHIGRHQDIQLWNQVITNKGKQWLNKTPKIKVTDNTRLVVIDMLRGNYTKAAIQQWQEAALLLGLSEYLNDHDDPEIRSEMTGYLKHKFDNIGNWVDKPQHVDGAILAYAVMKLDFIQTDSYKKAFDYIWDMIKEHVGKDGTVAYRKYMKSYRYVDTIGFICPFLVRYGAAYNRPECLELAVKQIKEYELHGMLNNVPCHAFKLENKAPAGLFGWGRGLGWYAIGLIDSWQELPPGSPHKALLEQSVRKFAKAAMAFQQDDGYWSWNVIRGESRPDSSATATLGWFMLNAAAISAISTECKVSAEKAIRYLMKVTRRNGEVDFSQGDTKDLGVYSMLFNILPFTQGFCIRAINRYLKQSG